jgi:hypothetical protein
MSTNTPDHDRTEALPSTEPTEPTEPTVASPEARTTEASSTPERTESLPAAQRTEALPRTTVAAAPRPGAQQPYPPQQAPAAAPPATSLPAAPEVVRGPYLAPIILGLVCLAVAAAAFAQEIANWTIDWGNVGPLGIVVAGVVLVLVGTLGLLSSRRRRR